MCLPLIRHRRGKFCLFVCLLRLVEKDSVPLPYKSALTCRIAVALPSSTKVLPPPTLATPERVAHSWTKRTPYDRELFLVS